jgi:hypothetical protein
MRRCTVCDHRARMAIDLELTGSETYRTIAGRYGLAESSLKRHKGNHVQPKLKAALARRADRDADTLIAAVLDSIEQTRVILAGASDPDLKLRAIDRLHRGLELRGKATGEFVSASVAAFISELGVGGEDQLRRIVATHKELENITLEGHRSDIVEATRFYLSEHPEDAGRLRAEMFGEREVLALAER